MLVFFRPSRRSKHGTLQGRFDGSCNAAFDPGESTSEMDVGLGDLHGRSLCLSGLEPEAPSENLTEL